MSKKSEPIPEYLDAMQPDVPEPDPPDPPNWRAVKNGCKWGAIAGFILSHLIIASNSIETPFGSIYGGNMLLLYAVCIGSCTAIGGGIGWLNVQKIDDERASPPSFPREPFG